MDPTSNTSRSTSENRFGLSTHALGTPECTQIQGRVNRIAEDISGAYIGLSAYQMCNTRAEFGAFTVKNPETDSLMPVKIYNAWGSDSTTNGDEVIISKLVAETLNLKQGNPIEIERKMDLVGAVKWACSKNKDNRFGQGWNHHSYAAVGNVVSACQDTIKGRNEIYLTDMQTQYLRLGKHLIPLCGEKKFLELKKISPDALGMVRLKYQNQIVEADVYSNHQCSSYPGAALMISESLLTFLGKVSLGADMLISSRFDKNLDEAILEDSSLPSQEMGTNPLKYENYFLHICSTPLKDLQKEFAMKKKTDFFGSAAYCLLGLAKQAAIVADHPEIYQKITFIFSSHVYSSQEYSDFLHALMENNEILSKHWDRYLNIIQEKLLEADPGWRNPQILKDFIKMGFVNRQNSKGETIVHIAFSLGRGSFELEKKKWRIDFNIRNREGQTPLHYATKNGNEETVVILYKKELNPLVMDNNKRIPLHLMCMNRKIMAISVLFEQYPDKVELFLSAKDCDGKTPFDYLSQNEIAKIVVIFSYFFTLCFN
jgi:hypothetical protein